MAARDAVFVADFKHIAQRFLCAGFGFDPLDHAADSRIKRSR
ncbi:MAG: hypothetical protein RIA09_11490 [Hoeflea sp.]